MGIITTYSNLGFVQQPDGGNNNTWGDVLDSVIASIDQAIAGITIVPCDGSSNVTLTFQNGDLPPADQARNAIILLTGVLTGNINLIVPQITKSWYFINQTTGAFSITVTTTAPGAIGTNVPNITTIAPGSVPGVSAPTGWGMLLYCNGINVIEAINFMSSLTVANLNGLGGNLSGFTLDGGVF